MKALVHTKIKFAHYLSTLKWFEVFEVFFLFNTKQDIWGKKEEAENLHCKKCLAPHNRFVLGQREGITLT